MLKTQARQSLQGKWGLAVKVTILLTLIKLLIPLSLAPTYTDWGNTNQTVTLNDLLVLAWDIVVVSVCTLGFSSFFLRLCRAENPRISVLFSYFTSWHNYIRGVLSYLLPFIYVLLWSLLFLIPGIIKSFSYAMTNYILIDHPELSVNAAITKSREMMNGNKWRLFVLYLSFIGWVPLVIISLGIGLLWLIPYVEATVAQFYLRLATAEKTLAT
jgi:uncharacterized membrane protein